MHKHSPFLSENDKIYFLIAFFFGKLESFIDKFIRLTPYCILSLRIDVVFWKEKQFLGGALNLFPTPIS